MSYDVIIVGAGSAGCVLAARLSEDARRSVLLLEAGPDYPDPAALPPEIASSTFPAYTHDWDYYSEPGAVERAIHLPRGKLVGGCSATNGTGALRGAPRDYDGWAAVGNAGWSFEEVLPFFRRLETDADFDDAWHGRDGPLPIRRVDLSDLAPPQEAFLQACTNAGLPYVADHNAPGAMGIGPWPTNGLGGVRQSAALTYLQPARSRPNLTILGDALVERVVFDGRRSTGVRLAGSRETLEADKVILSSGTYGSPTILMRSGIGPAEQLRSLGIEVVEDLPGVGQNLADHPLVGVGFALPLSAGNAPGFQMLLTWYSSDREISGPDLHVFPYGPWPSDDGSYLHFSLFVGMMRPRSRGMLALRSADPTASPVIDLGFFTHPDDMPRLVEGVRLARRLSRAAPLSEALLYEIYPGAKVSDGYSDLEAAILERVETYHHAVGTCRMGPSEDGTSVVSPCSNVHGVEGLYVVDASIMPAIPCANTNLPTMMVAERCAGWLGG